MELVWYRMLGAAPRRLDLHLRPHPRRRAPRHRPRRRRVLVLERRRSRDDRRLRAHLLPRGRRASRVPFALGDRLAVAEEFLRDLGQFGFQGYVARLDASDDRRRPARRVHRRHAVPAADLASRQRPRRRRPRRRPRLRLEHRRRDRRVARGRLRTDPAPDRARLLAAGRRSSARSSASRQRIARTRASSPASSRSWRSAARSPSGRPRRGGTAASASAAPRSLSRPTVYAAGCRAARRTLVWDQDGRESAVALIAPDDYAFVVNGKVDGSARGDAARRSWPAWSARSCTRSRAARSSSASAPAARPAGSAPFRRWSASTSSSSSRPSCASRRRCTPVNHDVLHNPKVHIRIGDAREVLLATPRALRHHLLRAVESLPRRNREPFYRRVLSSVKSATE